MRGIHRRATPTQQGRDPNNAHSRFAIANHSRRQAPPCLLGLGLLLLGQLLSLIRTGNYDAGARLRGHHRATGGWPFCLASCGSRPRCLTTSAGNCTCQNAARRHARAAAAALPRGAAGSRGRQAVLRPHFFAALLGTWLNSSRTFCCAVHQNSDLKTHPATSAVLLIPGAS